MAKHKLTDDKIDEICTYIENGMSDKDAADLSEICRDTFYRWLREADAVDKDGKPPAQFKQQRKLKNALIKARASFKAYHVQRIIRASQKNWTASAWLLERKFPEEFASLDRATMIQIASANTVQEDDGLVEAIKSASIGIEDMTGDEPEDV